MAIRCLARSLPEYEGRNRLISRQGRCLANRSFINYMYMCSRGTSRALPCLGSWYGPDAAAAAHSHRRLRATTLAWQ